MSEIVPNVPKLERPMTAFEKTLFKVIEFAHDHDESTFQTYGQYRSFKSKKLKPQHKNGVLFLIEHLEEFQFYDEHIFWCRRLLTHIEENNMLYFITTWDMIRSYKEIENDEMVVELGIKAIKNMEKEKNYTLSLRKSTQKLCCYLGLYYMVAISLMDLKRLTDGAHFINECIEAHFLALSYNPQEEIVDKAHR